MITNLRTLFAVIIITCTMQLQAQTTTIVDSTTSKTSMIVIPGKRYDRGGANRFFWGRQWRDVWSAPVRIPKLFMDTAYGGLTPTKKGGGKQTKNLRLDAGNGKEYAIRSIDKNYGKSIPEEFRGTFLQDIVDDQMSSSFPYAGVIVKKLAAAAGIYSTNPFLYVVGREKRLDSFKTEFENNLYSFEERPGEHNAKFYGAEKINDAGELFEALQKHPYERVDQTAYAKARLFDLLIGDWDRHFDQWQWAKKKVNGDIIYTPLPKDRDQAFASYDGVLLRTVTKAAKLSMLQPFTGDLKDVEGYTWVYRNHDAALLNTVSSDTWLSLAKQLQTEITDAVIEDAVKQIPAEVYSFSAPQLIPVLKSRRDHLQDFASAFYKSLSKEVVILGSEHDDKIEVINQSDNKVQLNLYSGEKTAPYYSRSFSDDETKEIRVYGMNGKDDFIVSGPKNNSIVVRLIGGPDKDKYEVPSGEAKKIVVYDDKENNFGSSSAKMHVTKDSMLYQFNGKSLQRDGFKIGPKIGYTNEDRIYVGLGLTAINYTFMDSPFTSKNELAARYSITQKAFSYGYKGLFRNVIKHIDLGLLAEYDQVRDQHFLGVGNNTAKTTGEKDFFLYRNKEANVALNLIGNISKHQTLTVSGSYQMVQLYNDAGRYISLSYTPSHKEVLDAQNFLGARISYDLNTFKNAWIASGGAKLRLGFEHAENTENKKIVNRVSGLAGFTIPLGSALTFSSKVGAAKLWGDPEFYQLNKIGGGSTLRGYLRYRFYGTSSFYNQNEVQWNINVKSYLFNGTLGLIGLFDDGRVWLSGETSDKWHTAVGGGIMIAPFNKISVTATYAVSSEDKRVSLRIGHLLSR